MPEENSDTALMWIHPDYHTVVEPLITSHLYKKSIQEKFYEQGTDEMTNYFVIPKALEYYHEIGGRKFLHDHRQVCEILFDHFHGKLFRNQYFL